MALSINDPSNLGSPQQGILQGFGPTFTIPQGQGGGMGPSRADEGFRPSDSPTPLAPTPFSQGSTSRYAPEDPFEDLPEDLNDQLKMISKLLASQGAAPGGGGAGYGERDINLVIPDFGFDPVLSPTGAQATEFESDVESPKELSWGEISLMGDDD